MEAHAKIGRRSHRVIEPGAVRIEIEMVGGCRAAAHCELGKPQCGRPVDMFGPDVRPYWIEGLQPAEQRRVLSSRYGASQVLEQVMMRVDHAWNDHMACHVDHPVGVLRQVRCWADRLDHAATREQATTTDFGTGIVAGAGGFAGIVRRVHRAKQVRVAEKKRLRAHQALLSR